MHLIPRRRGVRVLFFLLLAVVAALLVQAVRDHRIFSSELPAPPRQITDAAGRSVLLHGMNLQLKEVTRSDEFQLQKQDVERMNRDWGLNVIRLAVRWQELEPEPRQYNDSTIEALRKVMDWSAMGGVKVFINFHQDIYGDFSRSNATGQKTKIGNGAPYWAVRTDGLKTNLRQPWFLCYFQPGVRRAFDNLYDYDKDPTLQDHYLDATMRVVAALRGHPALLGYDIMNEPHYGSKGSKDAEIEWLHPFYTRFIERLRAIDSESWVFFESPAVTVNGGGPSNLPALKDPRHGEPRLVYAPHWYPVSVVFKLPYLRPYSGTTGWHQNALRARERLGTPLLLGEFKVENRFSGWDDSFEDALRMGDRLGSGWVYWDLRRGIVKTALEKGGNPLATWAPSLSPQGEEQSHVWPFLVRPYAPAVAGRLESHSYDPQTRRLQFAFRTDPALEAPTEIFLPRRVYQQGWKLELSEPEASYRLEADEAHQRMRIHLLDRNPRSVKVTVTPRESAS